MADEVSNAELARRLDSFQRDVHADISDIGRRLDAYVLREVYASDMRRLEDHISTLERQVREAEEQRRAGIREAGEQRRNQLRWVISAVLIPVVVFVVQVVLAFRGGSP